MLSGTRGANGVWIGPAVIAVAITLSSSLVSAQEAARGTLNQPPPTEPGHHGDFSVPEARSGELKKLLDDYVDFLFRESPLTASGKGDERFNDKLNDESPAAYERRHAAVREFLARAKALDRAKLSGDDSVNADLLIYEIQIGIDGEKLHQEQMPINSQDGPHIWLPQMCDSVPMSTPKHYADYAARIEAVPTLIDQQIEQMRLGMAAGRVPPRVVLGQTAAQCLAQATPEIEKNPELSPFYKPFATSQVGQASAARAREAIVKGIVPAYRKLAAFVKDEYIPKCRETLGISEGVDGPDAYAFQLRWFTTTDMTPMQVHMLGLQEVARIKEQMLACIAETDFPQKNTLKGDELLKAFIADLRSNPRFYYTDKREMLRDYRDLCKRIDAELPKFFRTLPRNSYGVRELPAFMSATAPAAFCYPGSIRTGIPGYFMVNTYQLDQRPKYGMVSLTLHESVPGHHLQLSIADELEGLHQFRTLLGYTAFVEGWALYSESLGLEMSAEHATGGDASRGFYADPYDYFGRLSDEMWRAARLVVDTGLHAQKWSRQRALDYMLTNTAGTETDLSSEVDRYIGWPGQACAYKIGEIKIKELRARASKALGDRFDLRAFHDELLGGGALPLPVLEARIDRWIDRSMKAAVSTTR